MGAALPGAVLCHLPRGSAICPALYPPLASSAPARHMCADARPRTPHRHRAAGQNLQDRPGGGRHLVHAHPRLGHGAARRQRRRQDHDHRLHHGTDHADLRPGHGAGRRDAAAALSRAAPDEFRKPLCGDADAAHHPAEPHRVRHALRRARSGGAHRADWRRARSHRIARPPDRKTFRRPEDPCRAGQRFDQRAGAAAARRAHRLARSRHRRLGARPARALSSRAQHHDADRVPQHGRGRTAVRPRHHHEARPYRGRRHTGEAFGALRPAHAGRSLPRRGARPRHRTRGRAMTMLSDGVLDFSPRRTGAMMLRYWYLLRSSWPRLLDLVYWPTVQMVTWGFLQFYIVQNAGFFAQAAGTFIGAVLLWDILFRGQLGFSISFMEEMWARNIGNLMMSPLRPFEFIAALMVMSIVRLAIGTIPVTFLAIAFL